MREIATLDELKLIELNIMEKIHDFCASNKLTYYLSHGTLIGAIRHQGFIPWDDDIDIFMPRSDYNLFLLQKDRFEKEYSNIEIVNHNSRIRFMRPISKVIDSRTILLEKEYVGDDSIGVFVDIWPLDGCPRLDLIYNLHVFQLKLYQKILYSKIKRTKSFFDKILLKVCKLNRHEVIEKIIRKSCQYSFEESEYVTCYVDGYVRKFRRDWFGDGKKVLFESRCFLVPENYDRVLHCLYGNYKKMPPPDKQIPHHISDIWWK